MKAVVIDTNVILVAKGRSEQAWSECVSSCRERLNQIIEGAEKIIIDDNRAILGEYIDYLEDDNLTTDERINGHFLEWFIRNYTNTEQCVQVTITPIQDGRGFEEFPDDPELSDFDPDDRKFIAVAVAYENKHQQKSPILQAVDSQWYGFRELFVQNGLIVEFVCEENIRYLYERRQEN
ncbi:hypothetical protein J4G07_02370 [Candidatus Poribacteria bacterium]|nr:hypothetical protein [Candidatus Poribacteria bacterium]